MIGRTVAIYRNRRTGKYRIQPSARAGGVPQEFGPNILLPQDVNPEQLLNIVLENLPKTDSEEYVKALAPKYSPEEYRRILKEEQLVHVEESDVGFKLVPSKRMRNSFGSIDDMTKTVTSADFLRVGGHLIREMFDEIP